MNLLIRASASLLATAAAVSIACVSIAQTEAPPPGSGAPPSAEQRANWMHERLEARAKALHAILNLRPDQEAAFQAFEAAMAPQPHGDRGRHHDAAAPMTTPQRLDLMADRMARREAEFHRHADAIKTFYAVLSPEQQRAFDALPMMGGEHRGMGQGPMQRGPEGGPGDHD